MAFEYKNPISSSQLNGTESVSRTKTYGTNFSVLQVGGYMEVYNLSDLEYTIPSESTGIIEFSGNSIPIQFSKRTLSFLPDTLTLNSDNISSGRRRLGMLVYVHETNRTYQYQIDDYETYYNAASGSTTEGEYGTTVTTSTAGGQAFVNLWTGSTIEGVSGVTRENARWRVFWGTDWQVTGGSINYNSTGTLALNSNSGNTVNISGFTTITGGTYSSGTTTMTLVNNLGQEIDITGFTSGSDTNIYNSDGVLTDNRIIDLDGNDLTFLNNTTGEFKVAAESIVLSANTGGNITFKGISSSSDTNYLVIDANGNLSYNTSGAGGDTAISAITYNSEWGITTDSTDATSGTTQLPFITGGTFDGSNINLNIAGGLEPTISISGPETADVFATGGTLVNDTLTIDRNDGNSFDVTGFTDTYYTGSSFNNQTLELDLNDNQGGGVTVTNVKGLYVSGGTYSGETLTLNDSTGGTITVTGFTAGTSGTSGTSGSSGTSGQDALSSGVNLFFNASVSSDISGDVELGRLTTTASEYTDTVNLTANQQNVLVNSSFVTVPNYPGVTVIPNGIWHSYLYFTKNAENDNVSAYYTVSKVNLSGGSKTLLFTSDNVQIGWDTNNTTPVEIKLNAIATNAALLTTDRIVIDIYVNNGDNQSRTITFYTEGTEHYSYVVTTLGVASGTSGSSGTSGTSGSSGSSGTSGTSGSSGSSGTSGTSGSSGSSGTSGTSGSSGSSGTSGTSGSSGSSGTSGTSGSSGSSGTSGTGFTAVTDPSLTRVLTSDGTAHGAIAESGFTYDGNYVTTYGGQRIQTVYVTGVSSDSNIITFPTTTGNSAHFEYNVINGSNSTRSGVVMAVWDSSLATFTDTSTPDLNGSTEGIEFNVDVSGGDVRLRAIVTSGTWSVNVGLRIIF